MSDLSEAKALVRRFTDALDAAPPDAAVDALSSHVSDDYHWRGMAPFGERRGAAAVAEACWTPFKAAVTPIQRRRDIFFAGKSDMNGAPGIWVAEMGHLLGNFDAPWLGLRPTRRMLFLRYAEFHRVTDGRIAETATFADMMGILAQIGSPALPASTGSFLLTPGPADHAGVLTGDSPPEEGRATLALIERMIDRLLGAGVRTTKADLEQDWVEDMLWWGPAGIGASYTQARYLEQHCAPFETGLEIVGHAGHIARLAEGMMGGFFGYPSLIVRPAGGYLGLTTRAPVEAGMRIVDLYRRAGDRLAENWIFIDHLHFLEQLEMDLLARHRALVAGGPAGQTR